MNSVQIHLALTHAPVIISLTGLVMLVAALVLKNNILTRAAYVLIIIAGIAALPVYFSGEGAEEAVEHLPGISESIIEEHEDIAKFSMLSVSVAALLSIAAFFAVKWNAISRILKFSVLLVSLVSAGLMIQTAHLGGKIRHTELSNGLTQNGTDLSLPTNNHDNDND